MEGDEPSMYSAGAEGGVDESTRPRLISREASESVLTAGMGGPSSGSVDETFFMRAFESMVRQCGAMPGVSSTEKDSGVSSSSNLHGVVRADRAHLVEKILSYRENTNINLYLKALEADLTRLNVCRDDSLNVLLSKLPPKAMETMSQISCEAACTYLDVKKKVLDEVVMDIKTVESQTFVEWKEISKNWAMVTRLEKLNVS